MKKASVRLMHTMWLPLGALCAFFSLFYTFAMAGIPYEQLDGITRGWMMAVETPWEDFAALVLRPFSVQLSASDTHLADVRITESIIQKGLHALFGESLTALLVYNVIAAVFLIILVYSLCFFFTKSRPAAFFTTAFLFSTPAYLWVMMEYGDYSPTDQLFLSGYFAYFLYLFRDSSDTKGSKRAGKSLALKLVVLYLLGILAVHAKETNKILLPGVTLIFLAVNPSLNLFNVRAKQRIRLLLLAAVNAILALPLVIVKIPAEEPMKIYWLGPVHQFLFQPNGINQEPAPALFYFESILPISVLSNFGFFLGWSIVGAVIYLLIRKPTNPEKSTAPLSAVSFLGIWTVLSISLFLIMDSDTFFRYITWALLPFTLLSAVIFVLFIRAIPKNFKCGAVTVLAVIVALQIAGNLQHSLFFRRQLEKTWRPKWAFFEKVYKDYLRAEDAGLFDMYQFWHTHPFAIANYHYMPPQQVDRSILDNETLHQQLKQYGRMYVASKEELRSDGFDVERIAELDLNRLSRFSSIRAWRKNLKKDPIYLYRIERG